MPAQDLDLQKYDIDYQHFIDNINRLYGCADTAVKLVIGGGVFAFEKRRRPKQAMLADRR